MEKRRKGFTLVEILIVILILAALAAIVIPHLARSTRKAKIAVCDNNIAAINDAIIVYATNHGHTLPPNLEAITSSNEYFPDGSSPECPFDVPYILSADGTVDTSIHGENHSKNTEN